MIDFDSSARLESDTTEYNAFSVDAGVCSIFPTKKDSKLDWHLALPRQCTFKRNVMKNTFQRHLVSCRAMHNTKRALLPHRLTNFHREGLILYIGGLKASKAIAKLRSASKKLFNAYIRRKFLGTVIRANLF